MASKQQRCGVTAKALFRRSPLAGNGGGVGGVARTLYSTAAASANQFGRIGSLGSLAQRLPPVDVGY